LSNFNLSNFNMKKSFSILTSLFVLFGIFTFSLISAQEEMLTQITFPIPELGNCQNKEECKAFCDLPENIEVCLEFAEAHNLLPKEEIEIARKMLKLGETEGPGGCRGKEECEAYCNDISHIEECITFAEKHGLMPPGELEEAKKVAAAIKRGIKPPNCRNKAECDVYCSQPEHMEECITFAEAAGLIPPEEVEEAKKVLAAIRKGVKPPPCRGKEECDIYCSVPEHLEECLTFAEAAGFITPEEAIMIRKTGGKGPGGCRGKEECEAYCQDPAHAKECIDFAEKYGFMSPEEAEMARRMLAKGITAGPGGCKSKEECEAYCNELSHMAECIDFAEKLGLMAPEEAVKARKMAEMGITSGPGGCQGEEECRLYCEDPAHTRECIEFAVKIGDMSPEEAERALKGMEMMQRGGPGGCKGEEECKRYCEDPAHTKECIEFSIKQGFISPEEAQKMLQMLEMPPPEGMPGAMPPPEGFPGPGGPGGCRNEQECAQYCAQPEHFEECQQFRPPSQEMMPPPEQMMPPPEQMREPPPGEFPPPEEMMPPPEEAPQSLFDRVKEFLASLISILGF
jgi:hypothetical protein